MRKFRSLFVLAMASVIMTGCSGLNKMKKNAGSVEYQVVPEVLEAHAGQVPLTIKGTFPDKYFKKKVTLTAVPVLTYATGEKAYDKVQVLQGEKVLANNQVIKYSGGNFTYSSTIPYNPAMRVSELYLNVTGEKGKKSVVFDPIKIADGVIATSTLVDNTASRPAVIPDQYVRITPENQIADINYLINRSDIRSSELKGDDLAALKDYIAAVDADPNREFKSAVVSSYASPDGKEDQNEKLAGKRGESADKYFAKEFKDIESADPVALLTSKITAEDWEGFQAEVQASNLQDKDLILRVLSMYADPAVREREIKNMSAAYDALKDDILPKLRRSVITVNVDKIGRSDAEILATARTNFNDLSLEEQLRAGSLTNDLNEQLSFYQKTMAAHPRDYRAANNAGCVQLQLGRAADALDSFAKAAAINNTDEVKSNKGYAYILNGEYDKAIASFNSMSTSTLASKYGNGIVNIVKGEYDQAVNNMNEAADANLALAQILKGDINRAKSTLDAISNPSARASYLKAIVGARTDNKDYLMNNLRAAVSADSTYKEFARTDVEFARYWNDSTFQSIVR